MGEVYLCGSWAWGTLGRMSRKHCGELLLREMGFGAWVCCTCFPRSFLVRKSINISKNYWSLEVITLGWSVAEGEDLYIRSGIFCEHVDIRWLFWNGRGCIGENTGGSLEWSWWVTMWKSESLDISRNIK